MFQGKQLNLYRTVVILNVDLRVTSTFKIPCSIFDIPSPAIQQKINSPKLVCFNLPA